MLGVAAAASTGTILWYELGRLPDPETACGRDLLRWVATQDLGQYPMETRRTLARRLEQQFSGQAAAFGGGDSGGESEMGPQHREMLLKNLELLVEPWLLLKTEEYSALPAAERSAYVDRFLDAVDLWQGAAGWLNKSGGQDKPEGRGQSALVIFVTQIQQCRQHASPRLQKELDGFLLAVQTRWVSRKISRFLWTAAA